MPIISVSRSLATFTQLVLLISFSIQSQASHEHPVDRVLIATPMKNCEGDLPSYFQTLLSLDYPKRSIGIAILESDSTDKTDELLLEFIRIHKSDFMDIVYTRKPVGYELKTSRRHMREYQFQRRQVLAQARNDLLESVNLDHYDYVLWMDADAVDFPSTLIQDLVSVGKPVVAPHIVWSKGGMTYDRNSWLETLPQEAWYSADSVSVMFEGYSSDKPSGHRIYLDDYRRIVGNNKFTTVPLHGVGTAVLLVNSKVHRAGINFPIIPYKRRVESEGFGLLANDNGFEVVGLPNYDIVHNNSEDWEFPTLALIMASSLSLCLLSGYSRWKRVFVTKDDEIDYTQQIITDVAIGSYSTRLVPINWK